MTETGNSAPLVSLIVPVFNVASYIDEGLQSLVDQDFDEDYEIILIDDASTDNSLEACRRFATDYPDRFVLIESEKNAGVSVARNRGLELASGKYLMFFDPDDILPATALSSLYHALEQYDAEIVKGNLLLFDENSQRLAPDRVQRTTRISGEQVLTELYQHSRVRGHIGGKMFLRETMGAFRFTSGVRMAQDLLYFCEMFAAARSLVLLDQVVYHYRKHLGGSTGGKYERGSHIDWLGAVENSGRFATSGRQKQAHKDLLLRSVTQIARECRKIPAASAAPVLEVIEQKCQQWNIGLLQLAFGDGLGLRSISRYIKLQLALRQIRHNLSQS